MATFLSALKVWHGHMGLGWVLYWTYFIIFKKKKEKFRAITDQRMDSCRWTKACVSLWTRACQSSCQVWMTAWFLWLSNCFSCLPVDCSIMLNVLLCQVHLPTCLTPLQLREPACSFCLLNLLDFNTVITRESSGETRCLVTIALPHPWLLVETIGMNILTTSIQTD